MDTLEENKKQHNIHFIGAGSMGSAFIKGWNNLDIISKVYIINRQTDLNNLSFKVESIKSSDVHNVDILFLGTKPQYIKDVYKEYKSIIDNASLIVSMAAALDLNFYQEIFPSNKAIIRAMPNLPIAYNEGILLCASNQYVSKEQQSIADALFSYLGSAHWMSEEHIDIVTSVSGCGPAYFFYFVKSLYNGLVEMGIDPNIAKEISINTMIGSGTYLDKHKDMTFKDLISSVCSKKGMTEQAVFSMQNSRIEESIKKALLQATNQGDFLKRYIIDNLTNKDS